jgi:CRISPR/Cas system CSM-associated protein Csm3 (group 7 of RAMP superfamily)
MNREREGRHITKRIIVKGILVLDTPTCLGNGDAEGAVDMMLLRDSISPNCLLTGSSIAGALRNYLNEYECNYNTSESRCNISAKLLGDLFAYKNESNKTEAEKIILREKDTQSALIIYDAISRMVPSIELRDGVKIDSATGTAFDKKKYDLELLSAGTQFPLQFELLIGKEEDEDLLKQSLALALEGLKNGDISIGMKKRRGFGRCHVDEWQIWEFDLTQHSDRIAWLTFGRSWGKPYTSKEPSNRLLSNKQLQKLKIDRPDKRDRLFITAKFKLAAPLLIRSGQDLIENKCSPDVVHLHSLRKGKPEPIVSGTTLAGVLSHRAERIVNTLGKNLQIVYDLFGFVEEKSKEAQASRLVVKETVIENTAEIVQSRIAIDRFTGGAYHGALFQEQPVFSIEKIEETQQAKKAKKAKYDKDKQKKSSEVENIKLELELQQPKEYEIGLLLLLLKDLWTGDLPVGGTSSIGRGRLQGLEATIVWKNDETPEKKWVICEENGKLTISGQDKHKLEEFVGKFVEKTL